MADERDEPVGFKVVDRRSFSDDGSRRDETAEPKTQPALETQQAAAKPTLVQSEPRQAAPRAEEPEPESEDTEESLQEDFASFETLVSYLSTTALFQLGLLPGPGGERIPTDFVNARRTIDLLEILQEKTRGNLDQGESSMLETILFDLRMKYVELAGRRTA